MGTLILCFLVAKLIFSIYYFVKSVKTKKNKNWIISFSITVSSLIGSVFIGAYSVWNTYLNWDVLNYIFLVVLAFCADFILFVLNLIFFLLSAKKKKQNNIVEKTEKSAKIKGIILPVICILLFTTLVCATDYFYYVVESKGELNTYSHIKSREIKKMANFLNEKYDLTVTKEDCTYYREQDYTRHSDIFGNGSNYAIPFISVFEKGDEKITVVNRNGFLSDNRQLDEINEILTRYFYQKTGILFEYIEFQKSYVGSWQGNDNVINEVLQTKCNSRITNRNIEKFFEYILEEPSLSITFYLKNDNGDIETLKQKIICELEYLREYKNIEILNVYGFGGQLIVQHKEIDFPEEQRDYGNHSDDYNDRHKFGCYYIDPSSCEFTFSLTMDLDRGYLSPNGELINGWVYRKVDNSN